MNGSINSVTSNIQIALAPVFLLAAVSTLIMAITTRLGRSVDRIRFIQREVLLEENPSETVKRLKGIYLLEFRELKRRSQLCTLAILCVVLSGVLISITVLELFLFQAGADRVLQTGYVILTFVMGLSSFILALILVLIEVIYAYYSVSWKLFNEALLKMEEKE